MKLNLKEIDLKETNACMKDFQEYVIKTYREKLFDNKPGKSWNSIATRNLYNSISVDYTIGNESLTINVNLLEYWKNLENGIKKGTKVPINALIDWIRVKPVLPRPLPSGKLPTELQLAFMIRKTIEAKGTQPMNFMSDTEGEVVSKFMQRLSFALTKDIGDFVYAVIHSELKEATKN